MTVDIAKLRELLQAATPGPNVRGMLAEKREGMLSNAEEWARSFTGECRRRCKHTAEEHGGARWHLASVYLDLIDEHRLLIGALPELLAVYEVACAWRDGKMPVDAEACERLEAAVDAARKAKPNAD